MRQYTGARYVPKFYEGSNGGDWDGSGVPYEALVIVTYLGNSYTSKKPVPVGVDITDQRYWAPTGSYNSQIAQMQKEIDIMKNRRIITIGDSYNTTDATGAGDNVVPWAPKLANFFGLTQDTDWFNSGYSGAGFVNLHDSGHAFIDQLEALEPLITDKDSITDIIVAGGTNDASHMADLYDAIAAFRTHCESTFKNAKISLFFISWHATCPSADTLNDLRAMYAAQTRGKMRSFPDAYSALLLKSNWCLDDSHPNNSGAADLAKYMYNALNGGYQNVSWVFDENFTCGTNPGLSGTIRQVQENTSVSCEITINKYDSTAIDFKFNTDQEISLSRLYLVNPRDNVVIGSGNGYCITSDSKVWPFTWDIVKKSGKFYFRSHLFAADGSGNTNPNVSYVLSFIKSRVTFNACEV